MNRFFATDEVYNERLNICKSCIYYFKLTGQCKRCLCFMKVKARLSTLSCPQKYWTKTTSVQPPDNIPEELIQAAIEIYQYTILIMIREQIAAVVLVVV